MFQPFTEKYYKFWFWLFCSLLGGWIFILLISTTRNHVIGRKTRTLHLHYRYVSTPSSSIKNPYDPCVPFHLHVFSLPQKSPFTLPLCPTLVLFLLYLPTSSDPTRYLTSSHLISLRPVRSEARVPTLHMHTSMPFFLRDGRLSALAQAELYIRFYMWWISNLWIISPCCI